MSGCEPDFNLIAQRRIKDMQAHLTQLLVQVQNQPTPSCERNSTPLQPQDDKQTVQENTKTALTDPYTPEQVNTELSDNTVEEDTETEIIEIRKEQIISVEFAEEEVTVSEKQIEVQASAFNSDSVLGDSLRPSADLVKCLSLNDSFRFSRELFDGDTGRMNTLLQQVSEMSSLDNAMAFITAHLNVEEDNETYMDFIDLIKKYFS